MLGYRIGWGGGGYSTSSDMPSLAPSWTNEADRNMFPLAIQLFAPGHFKI